MGQYDEFLNMSDFRPDRMYPGFYSPGQVAFNGNPEMSQLISMFSPAVLSNFASEGAFIPHMSNTMSMYDQYKTQKLQDARFGALYDVAPDNNEEVADRFLGLTKIMSDTAANDPLIQEQMSYAASIANSPVAKMIAGQFMGADNVEALLHGSRGDLSALTNNVSQMAYTMTDPSGQGKMSKDSIASYSRGLMSHLYDPEINVDRTLEAARSGDADVRQNAVKRLQTASQSAKQVVDDETLVDRLVNSGDDAKINQVYSKYISGGTETDPRKQAEAIARSTDATRATGVLSNREQSLAQAAQAAREAPVDEMRGFMAGQMGEAARYFQEKGILPASIGNKPLEERLKAISGTELSETDRERLGREVAREDLSDVRNQSKTAQRFRALTTEKERSAFLDDVQDKYQEKVEDTKKEIDKFAAGDEDAKSAEEISKMAGLQKLTTNVDSKKGADVLESYTDSLAAIREIFGDNGNPNAPMGQLLAALEGLAGQAQMEVDGKKISSDLMSIQAFAKESGTSMREVFAMKNDAMAQASALGLTEADALRSTKGALAYKAAAKGEGIFETRGRGRANEDEAARYDQQLSLQGQASNVNRGLAAMVAVYESDPDRFRGTELEAAAEAYKKGESTYEFGGEKKNLAANAAKGGDMETQRIVAESFGEDDYNEGTSAYYSAKSTEASLEYSNDNFVRNLQNAGYEQRAGDAMAFTVADTFADSGSYKRLGFDETKQAEINRNIGVGMGEVMLEAENKPAEERIEYIQSQYKQKVYDELIAQGVNPVSAGIEAQAAANEFSRTRASTALNATRGTHEEISGQALTKFAQVRSDKVIEATNTRVDEQVEKNEAKKRVTAGKEKTIMQRGSDYFERIAREGTNFSGGDFFRDVFTQEISEEEILDRVDPDAARAADVLTEARRGGVVNEKDIQEAAAAADAGDDTALKQLMTFSGLDPKAQARVRVVGAEEQNELIEKQINKISDDDLNRGYDMFGAIEGLEASKDKQKMLNELEQSPEFMRIIRDRANADAGVTSIDQLADYATDRVGTKTDQFDEKKDASRKQLLEALTYNPVTEETSQDIAAAVNEAQGLGLTAEKTKDLGVLLAGSPTEEDIAQFVETNVPEAKREETGQLVRGLAKQKESGGLGDLSPVRGPLGQEDYTQIVSDDEMPALTARPKTRLADITEDDVTTLNDGMRAHDSGEKTASPLEARPEGAADAAPDGLTSQTVSAEKIAQVSDSEGDGFVKELENQTSVLEKILQTLSFRREQGQRTLEHLQGRSGKEKAAVATSLHAAQEAPVREIAEKNQEFFATLDRYEGETDAKKKKELEERAVTQLLAGNKAVDPEAFRASVAENGLYKASEAALKDQVTAAVSQRAPDGASVKTQADARTPMLASIFAAADKQDLSEEPRFTRAGLNVPQDDEHKFMQKMREYAGPAAAPEKLYGTLAQNLPDAMPRKEKESGARAPVGEKNIGSKNINMSGTLTLDGLEQAILKAVGSTSVIETDGAPVLLD